ncbi:MAG: alpha/beta hydrolase [Planctomycetota bacterium]
MSAGPAERSIELPFTTRTRCLLVPPQQPVPGRAPPLLIALHGQSESGARLRRALSPALPPHFASAFPDGFHAHELRRPGKPIRVGHAWYLFTGDQQAFAASLAESEAALWPLVQRVTAELGADPRRVFLQGFSQGAYLAHCAALRHPPETPIAGWVAQSGRLKHEFLGPWLQRAAGRPVLIQHGRQDEPLPPAAAETSAQLLQEHGALVTLRLYDAGHELTPEMVNDLRAWLAALT